MNEQIPSNTHAPGVKSTSPRHTGKIVLALIAGILALCVCSVMLLALFFVNRPRLEARDAMISTELGEDGHIIKDTRTIPADAKEIHLEFYLENPLNTKVPLEFRWYAENQLFYSYSGVHENGYVAAYIYRDPEQQGDLPAGNYRVEVWFASIMLLSEPFVVE